MIRLTISGAVKTHSSSWTCITRRSQAVGSVNTRSKFSRYHDNTSVSDDYTPFKEIFTQLKEIFIPMEKSKSYQSVCPFPFGTTVIRFYALTLTHTMFLLMCFTHTYTHSVSSHAYALLNVLQTHAHIHTLYSDQGIGPYELPFNKWKILSNI